MDTSRNDQLGELAADASLERTDFLAASSAQLRKFLDGNADRIAELGGLVLIDDEVDYLAIASDLSFRSRSRYQDDATGKWVSETEVIESASELVELYNLADVFAAFQEATKAEAGLEEEPTATADLLKSADISPEETVALGGENPYAAAADDWAAAHEYEEPPEGEEEAAERLYDLALAFQERSQQTEAHLLEQFESAASQLTAVLGDLMIIDDEDERLTLRASGSFAAEVGRQPWIVYHLMRTPAGLSAVVQANVVLTSLILFTVIYFLLFAVFIYLLNDKIQHGPDDADLTPSGKLALPTKN